MTADVDRRRFVKSAATLPGPVAEGQVRLVFIGVGGHGIGHVRHVLRLHPGSSRMHRSAQ